jgi:hypothetical protein
VKAPGTELYTLISEYRRDGKQFIFEPIQEMPDADMLMLPDW